MDPRNFDPDQSVPIWFVPEQGNTCDDLLGFFDPDQLPGCTVNHAILQLKGGPGDHRAPPLTTVVNSWIPWDEPLSEELSVHWMIPDFTAYNTMCLHIADDAIDLRPDGVDPRDAEQLTLYLHHLPLTDFVYTFSELSREVRQIRDRAERDRSQLNLLVEWCAARDESMAGPLGLLLHADDL
eukprot:s4461_g4.t1